MPSIDAAADILAILRVSGEAVSNTASGTRLYTLIIAGNTEKKIPRRGVHQLETRIVDNR